MKNIFIKIKLIITIVSFFVLQVHAVKKAVIIEPVLEMNNSFPPPLLQSASPDSKQCYRAHQGLFNEYVNYVDEDDRDDAVKIFYDTVVYVVGQKKLSTFWTYKKGIQSIDEIKNSKLIAAVPHHEYGKEPTAVLTYPWKNFSIGTRLRNVPLYNDSNFYAVVWPDYKNNTVIAGYVPRADALLERNLGPKKARMLFVKIVNNLVDRVQSQKNNQVIAYVWGGSSCVGTYDRNDFYKSDGAWHRKKKQTIYSGYDCSEFIMRMAQIAGLKFPWKTSTVIESSLKPLTSNELLQEGDIIWIPGHVMIVSDLKNNQIIEARGYGAGYGCVHRITLSEFFADITTYDDLVSYYHQNKSIRYKNKKGDSISKPYNFKLLRLF